MAKKEIPVVSCTECRFAELHRWWNNPLIAICSVKHGERFVASCPMACAKYKKADHELNITQHDKYD